MSAPSAAVAVQPYQYIAGQGTPSTARRIPRMLRAQENDAERGIDGDQREIQLERDHVENANAVPYANAKLRNACEDVMTRSL